MLRQARRSRAGAGKRDEERYRLALAAYDRAVSEARERRDRAVARWRLLSALRWAVAVWRRKRAGPPSPPADRGPSRNEAALEAGAEGEREVHAALDGALDDSWTLFKGYRNRGGEIDYLLIGPTGLFAIEVKHVNGAFRITPQQWLYRRSDSYGNEVGDVTVLADRGGRPPQAQLAEPLEQLERFIAKRGQPVPWRPVVLLNHPRAKIISCADGLGAQVLTSSSQLLELVRERGRGRRLGPDRRDRAAHRARPPVSGRTETFGYPVIRCPATRQARAPGGGCRDLSSRTR